jgi:large subunit ribosomal protein L25
MPARFLSFRNQESPAMAESFLLTAKSRTGNGSRTARKLRKQGLLPGVVYGHKEATVPVAVSREDFYKALRHNVRLVDLQTDSKKEKALIREVQWDFLGMEVLHVDFARVSEDERIKVDVRLEIKGIAPGATTGGVLDQPMHMLHIECLAIEVPESIRVNIGQLQIGDAIHVKELELPAGVKALVDPEAVVVHVVAPRVEAETEAVAAPTATEQSEPEVIKREKEAKEEEEKK